MRCWFRLSIFAVNCVFLVGFIGWLNSGSGFDAALKAMGLTQKHLLVAEFVATSIGKTEVEQQALPVLAVLINITLALLRFQLTLNLPPGLPAFEQRSFERLGRLYDLGRITNGTLASLRIFLEGHVTSIKTRAAIAARREAHSGLWEAMRVCGTAGNADERMSKLRLWTIYLSYFLFYIFVLGSIALYMDDRSIFTVGINVVLPMCITMFFVPPLRYYKELFEQSRVPFPAVFAFLPGSKLGAWGWFALFAAGLTFLGFLAMYMRR